MAKEAPFDADGNMQSYPGHAWIESACRYVQSALTPVEPFPATMQIIGMETGRSAKRLVLKDMETGKTYPMFVADLVKVMAGVDIAGVWEACKRGQNYGIRRTS